MVTTECGSTVSVNLSRYAAFNFRVETLQFTLLYTFQTQEK